MGLFVFQTVFIIYITSPVITSYDSRWSIPTSLSILREGNTSLNEFEEIIKKNNYYAIEYEQDRIPQTEGPCCNYGTGGDIQLLCEF